MFDSYDARVYLEKEIVKQLSEKGVKDMRPQSTYNVTATYYYNVWNVELEEYVQPQYMQFKHSIVLATQLYSASTREPVWAIESQSKIVDTFDRPGGATIIRDEAKAISSHLSRDGAL